MTVKNNDTAKKEVSEKEEKVEVDKTIKLLTEIKNIVNKIDTENNYFNLQLERINERISKLELTKDKIDIKKENNNLTKDEIENTILNISNNTIININNKLNKNEEKIEKLIIKNNNDFVNKIIQKNSAKIIEEIRNELFLMKMMLKKEKKENIFIKIKKIIRGE